MAGQLTVDTLRASTGVLATQNGMTGIAKAYVNYNGVAQTVTGSFNVSSVTYNGVGDYTVNFTTSMPNTNYNIAFGCQATSDIGTGNGPFAVGEISTAVGAVTASSIRIWSKGASGCRNNPIVTATIFSS
jgi:hypothetical protein